VNVAALDPIQPIKPAVSYRKFDDTPAMRNAIYDSALQAFQNRPPLENATHRLEITDVAYDDYNPSINDEKDAILKGKSLHRPLRGTISLYDKTNNILLDKQKTVLAHVPHVASRGMIIRNGVEWMLRSQARLRPGVYARKKSDGGTEAHFNVKPGTGRGFRIELEPETGLFKATVGQSTTRLYPILKAIGISDDDMKNAWGEELFNKNYRAPSANDGKDLEKIVKKLGRQDVPYDHTLGPQLLKDILNRAEVDEDVTEMTMGERVKNLKPEHLLKASKKVLAVSNGAAEEDNRDSQAFQSLHSGEDFVRERLSKDYAGSLRTLLWKAARNGKLGNIQSGLLNKNISSIFDGSGLAHTPESTNAIELHDHTQAITRLGEGGISNESMVSRDAKGVQPSYLGAIDPVRAPESGRAGLDLRATDAAFKGSDGQLYVNVLNRRTGKPEIVSARTLSQKTVTFPGEWDSDTARIPAVTKDDMNYVKREDVDYELLSPADMFSRATAMIPFPESIKGQRLLMGSRMTLQSIPLKDPEAPFVQSAAHDGTSYHDIMSEAVGAVKAKFGGVVTDIKPDYIELATPEGKKKVELYNNYPSARKTMLHNTPVVKIGQAIEPGMLLAKSNMTDDKGAAAVGRNLRVAFMVAEGNTHEDAWVISESAAKKLTHEAMYKTDLDTSDVHSTKKSDYSAIYSDKYKPEQYDKVDEDGVIKVGSKVAPGDPLILAIGKKSRRAVGALMDSPRSMHTDLSQTWDHNAPGEVTDVVRGRNGIMVTVKSYDAMKPADKLTQRYGGKGVISEIRPDDQMPIAADGKPVEVIANALGIVSRVNPGALAESLLGKVAEKTGKIYKVKAFSTPNVVEFALDEALKAGVIKKDEKGNIVDTETVIDPRDGRKINNIFVGNTYFMKLHHMAEGKLSARDSGSYTLDDTPAKGGFSGSKRVGLLDMGVLLSSGATEFIKDAKLVRGQRNDDYWRGIRNGEDPIPPTVSFANEHFKNLLKGAGVNLRKEGTKTHLAPMLDEDVDKFAQHEIENSDTLDFETLEPKKGGLFDITKTGGAGGTRFAKITLPAKIPHPLFVDPIQKLLGVTGKQLQEILAGREKLHDKTGPEAVEDALKNIKLDREEAIAKELIRTGSKSNRDDAVRKLGYITGLKKMGVSPDKLMISKIPVLPPKFRPIVAGSNTDIVHDFNYLYHDVMEAKKNYDEAKSEFGNAGDEYLTLMKAVQAATGIVSPVNPKTAEQGVKGILRYAIGVGDTPKSANFQRKVYGAAVDAVGRSVITADPKLDIDQVGIPDEMAWNIFKPYVIRYLVRQGHSASSAVKAVRDRAKEADMALDEVVKTHPVVYNRAPALHKFNYVGAYAVRRKDDAIGLPYYTLSGLAGDHDGDTINIHVPSSKSAQDEVKEKLFPSKNLLHPATFEPHLEPRQDFLLGLYLGAKPDESKKVVTFKSAEDAKKAFAKGEITARTPIRIIDN
jgi:DNA-directed RNA polymerase beta subunit